MSSIPSDNGIDDDLTEGGHSEEDTREDRPHTHGHNRRDERGGSWHVAFQTARQSDASTSNARDAEQGDVWGGGGNRSAERVPLLAPGETSVNGPGQEQRRMMSGTQ
jgi:hypothetical protein